MAPPPPPACGGIKCTKSSSACKEAICGMEAEANIIDDNYYYYNNNNSNSSPNPTITNALLLDTDATDCSSSFETTTSRGLDVFGISEAEVESAALDHLFHPSRKKKLTKHWRKYILPLMWRCKWTELRMMEIESQGMNLARELALYNKRKLWETDPAVLESTGSRSYPYFRQYPRNKVMKRRKRRKVEDMIDVASYISQHNLFSFFENKKRNLDGLSAAIDVVNRVNTNKKQNSYNQFGFHDDSSLVSKDWNTGVEGIFEKLERVQSRVHKLKTQLENVMSEHAAKFSSSEDLSFFAPFDGQCSSNHSPNLSVGGICPIRSISDFDIEDLGFHDSAVSRFEEAVDMDVINVSTVAELPAADAPSSHLQIMDTDQKMVDDTPVDTSFVDAEMRGPNPNEVPHENPSEELKNVPCSTQLEPVPEAEVVSHGPSPLASSFISDFAPKNKRKRGERKVSSGSWIKRYSICNRE